MGNSEEDDKPKQETTAPASKVVSLDKIVADAALPDVSAKFAALAVPELGISKLAAHALPEVASARLEALYDPTVSRALTDALRIAQPDMFSSHLSILQSELAQQSALTSALRDPSAEFLKLANATAIPDSIFSDIKLQQEALRSVMGPLVDMDKLLGTRSLIDAAAERLNLAAIHSAALGPLADLRMSGILDNLTTALPATAQISQMLDTYESRYRLPELSEFAKLAANLPVTSAFAGLYIDQAMHAATVVA